MGDFVMTCAIFVCLFALALIALSKPLQMFLRFLFSAVVGGIVLFLGQSLGVSVWLNLATVLVAGLLGLPGVAGMFALSFLM